MCQNEKSEDIFLDFCLLLDDLLLFVLAENKEILKCCCLQIWSSTTQKEMAKNVGFPIFLHYLRTKLDLEL